MYVLTVSSQNLKKSSANMVEAFFCFILHALIMARIKIFKTKKCVNVSGHLPPPSDRPPSKMESKSLVDVAVHTCLSLWGIAYVLLQMKVNSYTVSEVNRFPNYLIMYAYHFVAPTITKFMIALTYYVGHSPLRKKIINEIKRLIFRN